LTFNGCEVHTPRVQYCCGSLHARNGQVEVAKALARRQIDAFDVDELDAIITNAAGCGSHLKSYGILLAEDPQYSVRARAWSAKVRDIHEWLCQISFRRPKIPSQKSGFRKLSVTYHEACHLCHGQKITKQPREVLNEEPRISEFAVSNQMHGERATESEVVVDSMVQGEQRDLSARHQAGSQDHHSMLEAW
jgi:glycolate oxidase iron-sulfur subunit